MERAEAGGEVAWKVGVSVLGPETVRTSVDSVKKKLESKGTQICA